MAQTDMKGFDHPPGSGTAWSWPELDDATGSILRPAHAWASPGLTVCGEPWPHVHNGKCTLWNSRPGWKEGDPVPTRLSPTPDWIARIRDGDRESFLCAACCKALKIVHHQAGPVGELP